MNEARHKNYRTPCGYAVGGLQASDGTRYEVLPTGQIVRQEPKMGKAELKRQKRARREKEVKCATD